MAPSRAPLPDFIIGGAPRCGTTSLAQALDLHPGIEMAKPFIPEPKVFMIEARGGAQGYLARYGDLFASAGAGLRGEKTSYYMENEDALRRIRETFTRMRFVFVVREPVARAYSNYLWSRRNGLETLSFEEAVALEGRRANPLPPERAYARPFDYLVRGDYATFAERYIAAFGREAIGLFLYERLRDAPRELLAEVQRFLGVDPRDLTAAARFADNVTDGEAEPLDEGLVQHLREIMRPRVRRFAEVSGLDIAPWGY